MMRFWNKLFKKKAAVAEKTPQSAVAKSPVTEVQQNKGNAKKTLDCMEKISLLFKAIVAAWMGTSDSIGGIGWRITFLSLAVLHAALAFGWNKIDLLFEWLFKTVYLIIVRLYCRLKWSKATKSKKASRVPEEKEIKTGMIY